MFNHEHAVAAHDEGQPPRAALSHITTTLTRTRSPITTTNVAQQLQHAHLRLRQWAHMLGFRGHFSTRTRHYSTTLTQLRAERTAWRTRQDDPQERTDEGQPVTDQHSDRCDLTAGHTNPDAGHRSGHRAGSRQRGHTDTTLVISHWQYAGSGLLPELAMASRRVV